VVGEVGGGLPQRNVGAGDVEQGVEEREVVDGAAAALGPTFLALANPLANRDNNPCK
jgi:hypothetical protein